MVDTNDLGKEVAAIGLLAGILTETNGQCTVNTDWFSEPVTELEHINTRLNHLVTLIDTVLGPHVDKPPHVFNHAQWYPVPDPINGGKTVFHIVTAPDTDTRGQMGFGILYSFHVGDLTIKVYSYVPLFSYSTQGSKFLPGNTTDPCQTGLYVSASDLFKVKGESGNVSFKALNIDTFIYLAEKNPTFELSFEDLSGSSKPSTYTTLESLLNETVTAWIGDVVIRGSYWLHQCIGASTYTPGDILAAAGFLAKSGKGEYNLDITLLEKLKHKNPIDIALTFLFAGLDALSTLKIPLVPLPEGGVYVERSENDTSKTADYGIRFATQFNIPGRDDDPEDGANGAKKDAEKGCTPSIDICLGSWMEGETDDSNWMRKITNKNFDCGLSIFFIRHNTDTGAVSFAPDFNLTSVGFNLEGGGDSPLINLEGYTLKGVDLRTYLDSKDWPFGFAVRLDKVGFPLGPGFDKSEEGGPGSNLVVQSLLSSGKTQEDTKDKEAVNPGFSAVAGYISGYRLPLLEIYDLTGKQTDTIWFPIQGNFGPVNCEKIGVKIEAGAAHTSDPMIGFIFDGGLALEVFSVDLEELSLMIHLKKIADITGYELDLQGMTVTFGNGGVEISGELLRKKINQGICYDGELVIKARNFGLNALGSFGYVPDVGVSLFAFGQIDAPVGGPPYFCVSGLAAGFGLNRSLKIPAMDKVQDFPLVAGLTSAPAIGGENPTPAQVLKTLEDWVKPERFDYWLAAGVQVTSCEIVTANVLLIVQFGKDPVLAGIGIGSLVQPREGVTFVYLELDLDFVFRPLQFEVQISAALTSGSFVVAPDIHLTGGFCFAGWFGPSELSEHTGDFVFTLGGYHPAFKIPSYYPKPSPLGMNWKVSDHITIKGGLYFAITPTAMMWGGSMELSFHAGALKAWLKAQVDAIMDWNPLNIQADAAVGVGVSYKVDKFFIHKTFSVEISADYKFWFPPYGGKLHVNWYVISFTVGFGKAKKTKDSITWDEFTQQLPTKTKEVDESAQNAMGNDTKTVTTPTYLFINAAGGLKSTMTVDGKKRWLVRPDKFKLDISSAIPASRIVVQSQNASDDLTIPGSKVALRKVNGGISKDDYKAEQTITIQEALETEQTIDVTKWDVETGSNEMPQAMWGDPVKKRDDPDINPDKPTVTGTVGVIMSPVKPEDLSHTPDMVIDEVFEDRTVNPDDQYRLPLSRTAQTYDHPPEIADSFADIASVNDDGISQKRAGVFTALQGLKINGWTNASMEKMAATPGLDFADEPLEGTVCVA